MIPGGHDNDGPLEVDVFTRYAQQPFRCAACCRTSHPGCRTPCGTMVYDPL